MSDHRARDNVCSPDTFWSAMCPYNSAFTRGKDAWTKVSDRSASDDSPPVKTRGVTARTVDKWIVENDKALSTAMRLAYDKVNREHVAMLKCSVCTHSTDKLCSARNFNPTLIIGSMNLRASTFKDESLSLLF